MTKLALSLARYITAPITSAGIPSLPRGIRAINSFSTSGSLKVDSVKAVQMNVGAIELTLIPSLAHSKARIFVRWVKAALLDPYAERFSNATVPA